MEIDKCGLLQLVIQNTIVLLTTIHCHRYVFIRQDNEVRSENKFTRQIIRSHRMYTDFIRTYRRQGIVICF